MQTQLSKGVKIRANILGIYQIIGGAAGVLVTISIFIANSPNFLTALLYPIPLLLYGISVYAGVLLLQRNFKRGLTLTYINQAFQIIAIVMVGYGFEYIAGIQFVFAIQYAEGSLRFGFNTGVISEWTIKIATAQDYFLFSFNFFAAYLLFFTYNLKKLIEKEQINTADIEFEEEPTNSPNLLSH